MTIAEASEKCQVSADTLRYYERIGLLPPVKRNKSGIRDFEERDLNWILFIKCMRNAGLSIETLIEYVSLFQQGDQTVNARKNLLVEQRQQLSDKIEEMTQTLAYLDHKIEGYEDKIIECEKKLK